MNITRVVEIESPSLQERINASILRAREAGESCVGIERVTEYRWLLLFTGGKGVLPLPHYNGPGS